MLNLLNIFLLNFPLSLVSFLKVRLFKNEKKKMYLFMKLITNCYNTNAQVDNDGVIYFGADANNFSFFMFRYKWKVTDSICHCLRNTVFGPGDNLCISLQYMYEGCFHSSFFCNPVFDVHEIQGNV